MKKNRKAFTIVELVIVIAVVAVLATVLVPTFSDIIGKAQDSKAMQAAKNAYTEYMIDNAAAGASTEYMIYEADGRFVALRSGAAVGVYESKEEARQALLDDPATTGVDESAAYSMFAAGTKKLSACVKTNQLVTGFESLASITQKISGCDSQYMPFTYENLRLFEGCTVAKLDLYVSSNQAQDDAVYTYHIQRIKADSVKAGGTYEVLETYVLTVRGKDVTPGAWNTFDVSHLGISVGQGETLGFGNAETTLKTCFLNANTASQELHYFGRTNGNDATLLLRSTRCLMVGVEGADTEQVPGSDPQGPFSLDGKTFIFLGSSVTDGSASNGWSMADYIDENNDCTVHKWAKSGTTLVNDTSSKNENHNKYSYVKRMEEKMKEVEECDHFIVQLSTNDATQGKPLGTVSDSWDKEDFDTSTVIGAIEYIIASAKEKYDCQVSFYTGTYYKVKYKNYNGAYYQQMVDALLHVAEKWEIGVLDLWNDPEMRAVSDTDYNRYMNNNGGDPIHPTRAGYKEWWGPKFQEHLEQYP